MKRTFKRILALALLLIGALALWVLVELLRGPVEPAPEHLAFEQSLSSPAGSGIEAEPSVSTVDGDRPNALHAHLLLEEGEFEIASGDARAVVLVEADYDAASYALEHELEDQPDGSLRFRLEFRRKISALRSLITSLRHEVTPNHLRVQLPRGVPLDLTLELAKGEHRIDLTGLSVTRLELVTRMGETRLVFLEPNPVPLAELEIDARMGDLQVLGLGHADARVVDVRGAMGDHLIDFEGTARGETSATIRIRMGSGMLHVPRERPLFFEHRSAVLGELSIHRAIVDDERVEGAPGAPRLRLDLDVRMGELKVR